jgi:release factor glutamine methyltransferase
VKSSPSPIFPTVQTALAWAHRQHAQAQLEMECTAVQLLLAQLLHQPRAYVLAHPDAPLPESIGPDFSERVSRLIRGEPLAYIIGEQEFFGLAFFITPDTLIPRPETERLVECALAFAASNSDRLRIAEAGTGSGCIAVSLASHLPAASVVATDISASALCVARRNVIRHTMNGRVRLVQCNLFSALAGPFDLICANLPYIPTALLQDLAVMKYEPPRALDGGPDGLRWIEKFLSQCATRLAPRGMLLMEIEESQGAAASGKARVVFPHAEICVRKDFAGHDRVLEVTLQQSGA